ncbi:hypothetical protein ACFEA8_002300 [Escherichia coli]|nr:hypothetical protein [Escherichia coli]ELR0704297.1 hypothetical protein [Escherichia coli]HEM8564168.1 hypothetical protein [Citrobacter farmeri]
MSKVLKKQLPFLKAKDQSTYDYFLTHLRISYSAPPVDFEGEQLYKLWSSFNDAEKRYLHHIHRAYEVWRRISISHYQENLLVEGETSELRLWVSKNAPDFAEFLKETDKKYSTPVYISEGINTLLGEMNEPMYDNAFEASFLFFMLAHYIFTSKNRTGHYNSMLKSFELCGQFRGYVEIYGAWIKRHKKKESSSLGGKSAAENSGAKKVRDRLINLLEEKLKNNTSPITSKTELATEIAPDLYQFIQDNKIDIKLNTENDPVDALKNRIYDWSKRKAPPNEEISRLFNELTKKNR